MSYTINDIETLKEQYPEFVGVSKAIDLTGQEFGYLHVLYRYYKNTGDDKASWVCQCKCGNIVIVSGKHLRSGNTKSCGCYQREQAIKSNEQRGGGDLTGKRFGKLVVLRQVGYTVKNSGKRARMWECQCDCGNKVIAQGTYLNFGDIKSCGCIRSAGETEIEILLKEHNIPYRREYSFATLIDKLPLRFDFAIMYKNNPVCLIEFQGEQHWQTSNGFYSEDIVEHDKMKQKFCEKHNIPLYCIKYKPHSKTQVTWEELSQIKEIREYNELYC